MSNKSISENLKIAIIEFALTVQMHGLPKLFNCNRNIFKIIWLISIGASSISCFILLIDLFKQYFEYPVTNKIYIIQENSIELPTLTFCDINPTIKNYSLSDKIIKCSYMQSNECYRNFRFYFDDWLQTNCYQLNGFRSPLNISLKKSDFSDGIRIKFFSNIIDEPRQKGFNNDTSDGLVLFISDKSSQPTNEQPIFLKPGETTYLTLNKKYTHKLTLPYNDCIKDKNLYHSFDSRFYSLITNQNFTYTQKDCFALALIHSINCSNSSLSYFQDCLSKNISTDYIIKKYFEFFANEIYKKYVQFCPLECDSVSYQVSSLSTLLYPSYNQYLTLMKNTNLVAKLPKGKNTSLNELRESVLEVNINYGNFMTTHISENAKIEPWDLVSTVGGLFSLFLGLSFLSLIDIIQISLEIIFLLFESAKNK